MLPKFYIKHEENLLLGHLITEFEDIPVSVMEFNVQHEPIQVNSIGYSTTLPGRTEITAEVVCTNPSDLETLQILFEEKYIFDLKYKKYKLHRGFITDLQAYMDMDKYETNISLNFSYYTTEEN